MDIELSFGDTPELHEDFDSNPDLNEDFGIGVMPSGVISVNGKTGNVIITRDDLDAQETLVSGKNIKTINGNSLLGSGNLEISGGGGTNDHRQLTNRDAPNQHPVSAITNLRTELDVLHNGIGAIGTQLNTKQDELVSGFNIKTINNQTLLASGNINIPAGSEVIANPTMAGTEDELTGLEVDGTKYKITGGGGGTSDYTQLTNKPSINNVTLNGDKTSSDLGLASQASVTDINSKIPSQASSTNQLADKDFVNSSISTATATFRGTFTSLSALQATDGNMNDYAFYNHTDSAGNTVYDRYKYVGLPESRVPEGYTQLASVEVGYGGGSGYIDTGIKINSNDNIYLHYYYEANVNANYFFGASDSNSNLIALGKNFNSGAFFKTNLDSLGLSSGAHELSVTNNMMYVDDSPVGSMRITSVDSNLYIFGYNNDGTYSGQQPPKSRLYEFTIFDSNNNKRIELIPCKRDLDNVVGVYDTVGNTFITPTNGVLKANQISSDKWAYEYSLNNSSFTAAQWTTINSGLTSQTGTDVSNIKTLIPSQASAVNQLADKDYVDSSISTATSTFRGTFTSLQTLQNTNGDRNDYAFYSHTDTAGNTIYDRYKYVGLPDSRVPAGYTEMLWLQKGRGATPYIDTGYKIQSTDKIYMKLYGWEYEATEYDVFGAIDSNNKYFRIHKQYLGGGALVQTSGGSVYAANVYNNTAIVECYDGKVYRSDINGGNKTLAGNLALDTVDANLYLFAYNKAPDGTVTRYPQWVRIGDFIIYDQNDNKKLELVPCSDSLGNYGYYETVSGRFIGPVQGSGTFTAQGISADKWLFEYSLNNSSFTSSQWSTINSGLAAHVTSNGYDASATQVLKNVNGTLTWVTEA